MKIFFTVLFTGLVFGAANPVTPTLPQVSPASLGYNTSNWTQTQPAVTGSVITVNVGDDIQTKYNAASCGDQLVIAAGVANQHVVTQLTLNKQCTCTATSGNWIQIVSANLSSIPVVNPITAATINVFSTLPVPAPAHTNYAVITTNTSGVNPVMLTNSSLVPGFCHWFGGIEITSTKFQFSLVGSSYLGTETLASQMQHNIVFDRCYFHGVGPSESVEQVGRGLDLMGDSIVVVNSYFSDIYGSGDSQAVFFRYGGVGALVINNFMSASTEVFFVGGGGQPISYSCTVAASPAPTTTSMTVNTCIDAAAGAVSTPAVGTCLMPIVGSTWVPQDWRCITGNTAGALTWAGAISGTPDTGANKVRWGLVTSDVTFYHNYVWKNPIWNPDNPGYDGISRSSKNCWEIKNGVRIDMSGNVCQNTWNAGQNYAVNFTAVDPFGGQPWATSSDLTMRNVILKNIAGVFTFIPAQGAGGTPCPAFLRRVLVDNILAFVVASDSTIPGITLMNMSGSQGCTPDPTLPGIDSLQVTHINWIGSGNGTNDLVGFANGSGGGPAYSYTNLVIQNNIATRGESGWANTCTTGPDGTACVTSSLNTDNTYTISHNAFINNGVGNGSGGINDATLTSRYGAFALASIVDATSASSFAGVGFANYAGALTSYMGYQLTSASVWHNAASDGTDPGVNLVTLNAALGVAPSFSISKRGAIISKGRLTSK